MALLPSGSSESKEKQLISVMTPYFDLFIKGPTASQFNSHIKPEDQALYEVTCEEEAQIKVLEEEAVRSKSFSGYRLPAFFEQTAYQMVICEKQNVKIQFDHDNRLIRECIAPVSAGIPVQMGIINFRNEIGLTEFRVLVEGKEYLKIAVEIYPTKISYKADYLQLREDVANEIYNLTFDFMRRTYLKTSLTVSEHPSLTEFFSIFKEQFQALHKSIALIIRQPHHEMMALEEIRTYREGEHISPKGISYINKHPQQVGKRGSYWVPKKTLKVHKQMTFDVYENQMVKHMLGQLLDKLMKVKKQYQALQRETDQKVVDFLDQHIRGINSQLEGSFFKEITKLDRMLQFSIVLQMSPVYQKFYKIYLILLKGLSISTDIFKLSNKNVAELYEYWCFIKLGSLLKRKHTLISADFIKADQRGLFVNLQKGEQSKMTFKNSVTGELFTLAYNQKLQQGPTVVQKPDNMLTLNKEMSHVAYRYVLDAKYKVDYEQQNEKVIEVPREEDINTMHRYRDAIVYKDQKKNVYEHNVFGGIILFPGTASKEYRDSRFYQSIEKVNIGALPFLPSQTKLVEDFLDEIIERIGHCEYEQVPEVAGFDRYLKQLQIQEKDVLIGPLRSKEQLQKCLAHNLYHTPCHKIKDYYKRSFQYVALYEQQALRTIPEGGIRYIGRIKNIRRVKRKELAELFPMNRDNGEEDYLVYEISSWEQRKVPILSSGQGVRRPNYTNSTLLQYARTVPELYIKDVAQFELILQLRRMYKEIATEIIDEDQMVHRIGENDIYISSEREVVIDSPKGKRAIPMTEFLRHPRKIAELCFAAEYPSEAVKS